MEFAFTRVSSKGQIVVPMILRKKLGFRKGKRLVLVVKGKRLLVETAEKVKHILQEDFSDLLSAAATSTGFWDNEKDEAWNNA